MAGDSSQDDPTQDDPGDVTRASLTLQEGWPPHLTASPGQESSSAPPGAKPTPPVNPPFRVDLASLREAESTIDAAIVESKNAYDTLKTYLDDVAPSDNPWIFAKGSPDDVSGEPRSENPRNPNYGPLGPHQDGSENTLDPNVQAFLHQQDRLLLAVADSIAYAGKLVWAIDYAGQTYSKADKESFSGGQ